MGLIFLFCLLSIIYFFIILFTNFGVYIIAQRREIANSWLALIPFIGNYFIVGCIIDDINTYRNSVTYYKFILLSIPMLFTVLLFSNGILQLNATLFDNYVGLVFNGIFIINIYNRITNITQFFIYRDYNKKNSILFLILSLIIPILGSIFIFSVRKNVPVSMCFKKEDKEQFKANQPKLQLLWEVYQSQPYNHDWTEFLTQNFVPVD